MRKIYSFLAFTVLFFAGLLNANAFTLVIEAPYQGPMGPTMEALHERIANIKSFTFNGESYTFDAGSSTNYNVNMQVPNNSTDADMVFTVADKAPIALRCTWNGALILREGNTITVPMDPDAGGTRVINVESYDYGDEPDKTYQFNWTLNITGYENAKFYYSTDTGIPTLNSPAVVEFTPTGDTYTLGADVGSVRIYVQPNDGYLASITYNGSVSKDFLSDGTAYATLLPNNFNVTINVEQGAVDPNKYKRQLVFNLPSGYENLISEVVYGTQTFTDVNDVWLDFADYIGTTRTFDINITAKINPEFVNIVNKPVVTSNIGNFQIQGTAAEGFVFNLNGVTGTQVEGLTTINATFTVADLIKFNVTIDGADSPNVIILYHQTASGREAMSLSGLSNDLEIYSNYPEIAIASNSDAYSITEVTSNGTPVTNYEQTWAVKNGDKIVVKVQGEEANEQFTVTLPGTAAAPMFKDATVYNAGTGNPTPINAYGTSTVAFNAAKGAQFTLRATALNSDYGINTFLNGQPVGETQTVTWTYTFVPQDGDAVSVTAKQLGYTFVVNDQNNISQIRTTSWQNLGSFTDNTFEYTGTATEIVFDPASGATIDKITAGSFDGTPISTSESMGGTVVSLNRLTKGETYYITTSGGSSAGALTYTFVAPEALSFEVYGATLNVNYSDGAYKVSGMTPDMYQSLNLKATEGKIESITTEAGQSIESYYGMWVIQVDDFTTNTTFNVKMSGVAGQEPETFDYTINCEADVLEFSFMNSDKTVNSTYANGAYTITGLTADDPVLVVALSDDNYVIKSAEGGETPLVVREGKTFTISVGANAQATTFTVVVAAPSLHYVVKSEKDILSFGYAAWNATAADYEVTEPIDATFEGGSYTLFVRANELILATVAEDATDVIENVTASNDNPMRFEKTNFTISTAAFADGTVFDVTYKSTLLNYTLNCAEDVLEFNYAVNGVQKGEVITAAYADGVYTLSNIRPSDVVLVSLSDNAENTQIYNVKVNGDFNDPRLENNQFMISTGYYTDGTEFTVNLAPVALNYTVKSAEDVLEFNYGVSGSGSVEKGDAIDATYADGAYTFSAKYGEQVLVTLEEGKDFVIESVIASNDLPVRLEGNQFTFSTAAFADGTVFEVAYESTLLSYTFNCAEDVLEFNYAVYNGKGGYDKGDAVDAAFDNGVYTVTGVVPNSQILVSLSENAVNTDIVDVRVNGDFTNPQVNDNQFTISTGYYPDGTEFTVNLAAAVLNYTVKSAEDVLEFNYSVSGNGTVEKGDAIDATYANGAYTFSAKYGEVVLVSLEEGTTLKIENVTASNDLPVRLEGNQFTFSTAAFADGTEFEVTFESILLSYTVNCAQDVLEFNVAEYSNSAYTKGAALDATYADGAYTVTGINPKDMVLVTLKDGVENCQISSVRVESSEGFTAPRVEDNQIVISAGQFGNGTVFYVDLAPETVTYTVKSAQDVLEFNYAVGVQKGDAIDATYANGAYTFTANYGAVVLGSLVEGTTLEIEEVTASNDGIVRVEGNQFMISTGGFPTGTVFEVIFKSSLNSYVVNCAEDVLEFHYAVYDGKGGYNQGAAIVTNYVDGAYVLSDVVPNDMVLATVKDGAEFKIESVVCESGIVRVDEAGTMFTFSTGQFVDGTEFDVTLTSTSGIQNLFNSEDGEVMIFNLNGVRIRNVENLTPGIYIVNGKKVVVRN